MAKKLGPHLTREHPKAGHLRAKLSCQSCVWFWLLYKTGNIALALSTPFRVLILGFRWVIDALGRKAGLRLPGSLPAMAQGKEHGWAILARTSE